MFYHSSIINITHQPTKIDMKKILLLAIIIMIVQKTYSQTYSTWITASKNPTLQVRWATKKDASNYNYLLLQLKSSVGCKLNLAGSLCSNDAQDKNGWKYIQLYKDKPATYSFKIMNSCTNGFWWWYKDYKSTAVKLDDN